MVEAAGVEPASQGAEAKTSTLVVDRSAASSDGDRSTGPDAGSAPCSHRRAWDQGTPASLLSGDTGTPADERCRSWLPVFVRQPVRGCCSHLEFFQGFCEGLKTSERHLRRGVHPVETVTPPFWIAARII